MKTYLIELLVNINLVLLIQIEGLQSEFISELLNDGKHLSRRGCKRSEKTF